MPRQLVQIVAFVMIAVGTLSLAKDAYLWLRLVQANNDLGEIKTQSQSSQTVQETVLDVNEAFYKINPDYVGWIFIADTQIDYPLVKGEDNAYYLTHDFYRKAYDYGAIFMDYRNQADFSDAHSAIYGHAARYQALFGYLNQYLKEDFAKTHAIIDLETPTGAFRYQIFAVYVVDASTTTLDIPSDPQQVDELFAFYQSQSKFVLEVPDVEDKHILSLVSCNYDIEDGRIVVQALRLPD